MNTIKTIVNQFYEFVDDHPMIYSKGYGLIQDLQTENRKTPVVWISSTPGKIYDAYTKYNFNIWILTNTMQDKENLLDNMSDTALLGRDITTKYKNSDLNEDFTIDNEVGMMPISMDFDDILSGWVFDFSIIVDNNYCEIPE